MRLRANAVSCRRGSRTLFNDVEFSLSGGGCLLVRGPNGSGKTTLLRALAGLSRPDAGNFAVDLDDAVFVGHSKAVKGQLTVQENIRFWARIYGADNSEAALRSLNLWGARDLPAKLLSAGQKQRLSLSRLTVSGRKIWILDEPTASLDADGSSAVLSLVEQNCASGGISVIATHLEFEVPGSSKLELTRFRPPLDSEADFAAERN